MKRPLQCEHDPTMKRTRRNLPVRGVFFKFTLRISLNQAFRARLPQRFTAPGWRLCYWLLLTAACCMSGQKFVYWKFSLDGVIT